VVAAGAVLAVALGAQVILPLQVHCKLVAVTVEFVTVVVEVVVVVLEQLEPAAGMAAVAALPVTEPTVLVVVVQVAIQVMAAMLVHGTPAQVTLAPAVLEAVVAVVDNFPLEAAELDCLGKVLTAQAAHGQQVTRLVVEVAAVVRREELAPFLV
jgi:hypothetical protein